VNKIKEVILKSGLRANHIADEVGVSKTDISNYIAENRTPNHERLLKLCKVLSCKIEDLYPHSKRVVTYNLFGEE
tara:strand:- start:93 stop:317 length:225 start_codon:yes stop_codon:yes gene_type:complete